MYDERLNYKMKDTKPDVAASAVERLVMFEFFTDDKFTVHGNDCFPVLNPRECDDFKYLTGKTVLVNGIKRKVVSVERFAHCRPWRKGEKIALMCET